MNELDKIDYEILYVLSRNNMISEIQSTRIKDLTELINASYNTIVRRVKDKLLIEKLVAHGIKDSRAHTFYITEKGIKLLSKKKLYEEE